MSLIVEATHQIPSALYSMKEADDLYFNITRVTEHNKQALKDFAYSNVHGNSAIGTNAFFPALNFYNNPNTEVWVAFISNKPVNDPNTVDRYSTEMFMTVTTSEHSPFTSHIGIARASTFLGEQHSHISTKFHAFASKFMQEQHPEKHYMINTPAEVMGDMIIKEFQKQGQFDKVFIGDNRYLAPETCTIAGIKKAYSKACALKPNYASLTHEDHAGLLRLHVVEQREMIKAGKKTISPIAVEAIDDEQVNFIITHPDQTTKSIITPELQHGEFAWFFEHQHQFAYSSGAFGYRHPHFTCDLKALETLGDLHGEIQLVGEAPATSLEVVLDELAA